MAKVKNEGRRWVGEDKGKPLVIEAGATADVSDALAEVLVPGCGFTAVKAAPVAAAPQVDQP